MYPLGICKPKLSPTSAKPISSRKLNARILTYSREVGSGHANILVFNENCSKFSFF
jgi:hypothetical protein